MSNDSEKINPTQEIIEKCIEDLYDEIGDYQADKEAAEINWEAKEEIQKYKTCSFVKSQKAFEIYTNLDLCVAVGAQTQAQLIGENVKTYSLEDDALEKSLKDAIKSIKEVKNILADVSDKACKLDRCIEEEERCNPDILKALKKNIPEFKEKLEKIKRHPKHCYDLSVKAFDGGVDVAGIQSFTDLNSLIKISADLITSIGAFKADIDANIKKAWDETQKGKVDLTVILQDLEKISYKKCTAETDLEGTCKTKGFIQDPNCERIDEHELDMLCRKVKKNFSDDEEGDIEENPCHDDKRPKKRFRKDQMQDVYDDEPEKKGKGKGEEEDWSMSE